MSVPLIPKPVIVPVRPALPSAARLPKAFFDEFFAADLRSRRVEDVEVLPRTTTETLDAVQVRKVHIDAMIEVFKAQPKARRELCLEELSKAPASMSGQVLMKVLQHEHAQIPEGAVAPRPEVSGGGMFAKGPAVKSGGTKELPREGGVRPKPVLPDEFPFVDPFPNPVPPPVKSQPAKVQAKEPDVPVPMAKTPDAKTPVAPAAKTEPLVAKAPVTNPADPPLTPQPPTTMKFGKGDSLEITVTEGPEPVITLTPKTADAHKEVTINGKPVKNEKSWKLEPGDELIIGDEVHVVTPQGVLTQPKTPTGSRLGGVVNVAARVINRLLNPVATYYGIRQGIRDVAKKYREAREQGGAEAVRSLAKKDIVGGIVYLLCLPLPIPNPGRFLSPSVNTFTAGWLWKPFPKTTPAEAPAGATPKVPLPEVK